MNSVFIPLLYPLQPGYKDADQWIDQLLNRPNTINWQYAFRQPLITDKISACIYDFDQNAGVKVYQKFFTLKVTRINRAVPGYPFVYLFEYYDAHDPEDIMVMEIMNSDGTIPLYPLIAII